MHKIEKLILSHLIYSEDFTRSVLPYVVPKYFEDTTERLIYEEIEKYVKRHNGLPTKEALLIEIDQKEGLHETMFDDATKYITNIEQPEGGVTPWLL